MFVTHLDEDEKAEAPETTVVTDSPAKKPSKKDKTKRTVPPGKAGSSRESAQANGTAAKKKANIQPKGKKVLPTGPKKAKIAKMDGETVKPTVDTAAETKSSRPKDKEKRKTPMKKNRLGKNKFKKLTHMLQKDKAE